MNQSILKSATKLSAMHVVVIYLTKNSFHKCHQINIFMKLTIKI